MKNIILFLTTIFALVSPSISFAQKAAERNFVFTREARKALADSFDIVRTYETGEYSMGNGGQTVLIVYNKTDSLPIYGVNSITVDEDRGIVFQCNEIYHHGEIVKYRLSAHGRRMKKIWRAYLGDGYVTSDRSVLWSH